MRAALTKGWMRFWFTPTGPGTLGFLRVLFFGGLFVCYRLFRERPTVWGGVDAAFWQPDGVFAWLHLPQLEPAVLAVLYRVWLGSLALACVGLFTPIVTRVALLLGAYLLGLPYSFGWHSHFSIIAVFGMAVMAAARSNDAWSLDDLWARRRLRGDLRTRIAGGHPASGVYTWPVRALWVAVAFEYFSAAISKLTHSGLAWVTSQTMAIHLTDNAFKHPGFAPTSRLGLALAQVPWASHGMAAAGLLFELMFPVALFWAAARPLLVMGAIAFNVSIYLLMGPQFYELIFCNAIIWVPWNVVGNWALRFGGMPPQPPIIFYDGVCNLCQGSVQFVITRDPRARFAFASLQSESARRTLEAAGHVLREGEPESIVLLEEGRVYERSTAALRIARALTWPWPLLWIFILVPRPLRNAIYDVIARHRYRWFGKQQACWLPTQELRARFRS